MSLKKYEPENFFNKMQSEFSEFFKLNGYRMVPNLFEEPASSFSGEWLPMVDIKESKKQLVFKVEVPGVDPKDIEVSTENGCLIVQGERSEEKVEEDEGHHLKECSYGMFERRFRLPENADLKKISAKGKHGVLNITVPKSRAQKSNRIEIKS